MYVLTFLVAVAVNFVGYIPFGNINLTAVQLSVNRGLKQAVIFILSFSVVEALFTYVLMRFAEWFAGKENLLHLLDYILIIIFLVMGIVTWRIANHESKPKEYRKRDSIRYGIFLGIFNPMQIPFWMIGGTYLISNKWIETAGFGLEIFALGAGIGAFSCLYLFAHFARYIQEKFTLSNRLINRSVAVVFFVLALIHIIKIVWETFY